MKRCLLALMLACATLSAEQASAPPVRQFKPPENWSNWNFSNIEPSTFPGVQPRACAAPLLAAPIDPTVDWRMPALTTPVGNIDSMPIAKGLPPCRPQDSRPKVWFVPNIK
jgi:hypothetical protein